MADLVPVRFGSCHYWASKRHSPALLGTSSVYDTCPGQLGTSSSSMRPVSPKESDLSSAQSHHRPRPTSASTGGILGSVHLETGWIWTEGVAKPNGRSLRVLGLALRTLKDVVRDLATPALRRLELRLGQQHQKRSARDGCLCRTGFCDKPAEHGAGILCNRTDMQAALHDGQPFFQKMDQASVFHSCAAPRLAMPKAKPSFLYYDVQKDC